MFWVDCATQPTTVLMSYAFWSISNTHRYPGERLHTFNSLKGLLIKLFAVTGGTYVSLQKAASLSETVVHIDQSGTLEMSKVCSLRLLPRVIDQWNQCRTSSNFPFVTTSAEQPAVWELIMFCIDPNCSGSGLQDVLYTVALRIFAHICTHLDEHAAEMCQGDAYKRLKQDKLHKNAGGSRRAAFALMLGTAQSMWTESVSEEPAPWLIVAHHVGLIMSVQCMCAVPLSRNCCESTEDTPAVQDGDNWSTAFTVSERLRQNGLGKHDIRGFLDRAVAALPKSRCGRV